MRPPCSLKTHLHSVTGWLRLAPLGVPGDLESGQGTGAWALNIQVSAGRHTCSRFQTSASCQNSGDPSLWRAGNEANINNAAYRAPARSYLYLRSPSILRGCPSPQFLLGMFRSAQGTHSWLSSPNQSIMLVVHGRHSVATLSLGLVPSVISS